MNMKCKPVRVDEVISIPAYVPTTGFEVGELLIQDTAHDYKAVPMTAATDDALFLGISLSAALAVTNDGDYVTIMSKGLVEITLTSAVYQFGAGLKWATTSSLVADGSANTIAWIHDYNVATRTKGIVLIDIYKLAKLFAVSA